MEFTHQQVEENIRLLNEYNSVFSQEEIDEYIRVLKKYESSKPKEKSECEHEFEEHSQGLLICLKCASVIKSLEHSSSYNDYFRCHFKKKSVYDRRYHFENKVNFLIKKFDLDFDSNTLDKLYKILNEINDKEILKKINTEFDRKRLIGINFLIKKILEVIKPNIAKQILIRNSLKTQELYNNYWDKIKSHISF